MTVLVLTRPLDATSDLVISELHERGVPVCRLDPGDFPSCLSFGARIGPGAGHWAGTLRGQHRDLTLGEVSAVYYRRPSAFRMHPGMAGGDTRWARAEARAGFKGLLSSLDCRWVNHPSRNAHAEIKPVSLATAARCGLDVPETLITNDPAEAREFVEALPGGTAAYKALGPGGPTTDDGNAHALWTTQVRAEEITDAVSLTAHLFQQWVPKAYEVRVTAVGRRLFAAEIHAGSDAARIDFRTDYDSLTYRPCTLPGEVTAGMHWLLDALQLRYAACDFLVSQDDGRWFLCDVNPNGQWGFVPELREPITEALADLLEGKCS
ncbi:ATP-grasp ribosomal peptide maturase [Streptomyces cacaoi]|uniref:ATP-grasp ribosomal peptide maturase n=1 Tax=Streptomyces cacaoi TaxID=1898 RepID=A0A4Y3RA83_STRCI|nr:ATP-grasp ribosomal peptide maturase [Streptomyces cacaoi]GEB54374.1 ATP-grasp ribosomal peptide maturase [Streptomyces cacaoi]